MQIMFVLILAELFLCLISTTAVALFIWATSEGHFRQVWDCFESCKVYFKKNNKRCLKYPKIPSKAEWISKWMGFVLFSVIANLLWSSSSSSLLFCLCIIYGNFTYFNSHWTVANTKSERLRFAHPTQGGKLTQSRDLWWFEILPNNDVQ